VPAFDARTLRRRQDANRPLASRRAPNPKLKEEIMRKLVALVLAATFAAVSFQVVAQDKKAAKPTAEQCKKDPKMKGCEDMKKK
jgi:hypothetical protein